ncbi:MAG TPA: hypothetical protein DEA08_33945 [Planctomycetes bacterium]|nr:hypothetical protein [Planctomycetota bacterium]
MRLETLLISLCFAPLAWLAGGCTTTEKINGKEYAVADPDEPKVDRREEALKEKLEEEPENVQGWFLLARHYQEDLRFRSAYVCYLEFQRLVNKAEEDQNVPMARRATVGLWHLSRIALQLGNGNAARKHMIELLDRQPKSIEQARLNPHFRDTHLSLGQIYYREGKNDRAYLHIMIHKELGGAEGDAILIGIEKRKAAEPAKASQPRDAEKDSQPAGAGKSGE